MMKIVTSMLSLAVAGAVFFVYTQPAYTSVQSLQDQIGQYNAALDKAKELQALKQSLLAKYNSFTAEQLDRLTRLLPDHVDNVRLVLDLDNMASRYGMAIQNVVISKTVATTNVPTTVIGAIGTENQKYDSLVLDFSTNGTYAEFEQFMQDLESSLRLVELDSFSIAPNVVVKPAPGATGASSGVGKPAPAPQSTTPNEPTYHFDLALRTFWLK